MVERTPPTPGKKSGSFLPKTSLQPPMKQSTSRLGRALLIVVIYREIFLHHSS